MGILELMVGRTGDETEGNPTKFSSPRYDVTYTVSAESHDIAYAVPIRRAQLDAFADLVRLERETPYVTEGSDSLEDTLDTVLEDESIDAAAWTEQMEAPRQTVEPILERWQETVHEDENESESVEIVYLPLETESSFAAFLQVCRKRDELEHDPFDLPEDVSTAASILSEIKRATDRSENRVVVNRRYLPDGS